MKTFHYHAYLIAALTFATPMAQAAPKDTCSCKPMPRINLIGTDGIRYDNTKLTSKPTILVYLKEGCPHNRKSAADFNRLYAAFGHKVNLVALMNTSLTKAKGYAKEFGYRFPIVADPTGQSLAAFGAKNSLDMALVCAKDKQVAQTWRGYDRKTIAEMIKVLPEHGGPKLSLSTKSFPAERQSGCGF